MATKGPSNQYGNTRGANHRGEATTEINYAWARDFSSNALTSHFNDHAKEMDCKTKEEYASKAVHFANSIDRVNYRSVVDKGGSTYKWNLKTGETVIVTKYGYVVSYSHMVKKGFHYTSKKGVTKWIKI